MVTGRGESVWKLEERWKGVERPYRRDDVDRLSGSVRIEYTLATRGAQRLWHLLKTNDFVRALGACTGTQAVQMVEGGLPAIYASGWQVAADMNDAGATYPDQSLYPADSMPNLVRRINNAFQREDEKQRAEGKKGIDWFAPVIADAEAGFGGPLNAFELTKALIVAGAAAIHLEDQLASAKKCGHLGGKVLVPSREFNQKLWAARLAADRMGVPTILIARTDALSASLLTSDVDPRDAAFATGERTIEGYFRIRKGIDSAIQRALNYAPYADLLWFESEGPDLEEARQFAEAIHARYPGKMLAYNCSPSFNWKSKLSPMQIERFQDDLGELGYRFQFVTLAGFHSLNLSMFELARAYARQGMLAYARLQQEEFQAESSGYRAVKHQSFVGTAYFDEVVQVLSGGLSSTRAMEGSTESSQFEREGASEPAPEPEEGKRLPGRTPSKPPTTG
jgi:isocitrate lyase